MKRIAIIFVAIGIVCMTAPRWFEINGRAQQARTCLHGADESPAQAVRRKDALRLVRAINTAEAAAATTTAYAALNDLRGLPPTPAGFVTLLAADAKGYAFAVKDSVDPCGFTFFSDQHGVIYVGTPLQ